MSADNLLQSDRVERRLRFESMLADLTAQFIDLPPEDVHREIEGALEQLCRFLDFDRSTVWELAAEDHGNGEAAELRHAYQIRDAPPVPRVAVAVELFPWVTGRVVRGETVTVERLDRLPQEAAVDRKSFERFGTRSMVALPLRIAGETIGILSFATIRRQTDWPRYLLTRLGLCAQVFADAIHRRRTDLARRQSEDRLTLAMDAAGAGMWSMDLETEEVWASARTLELFGLSPQRKLAYGDLEGAIHPGDRAAVRQALDSAARHTGMMEIEFRVPTEDDRQRWLRTWGRRQRGEESGSIRLVGLTRDVTDRKRSEDALRQLSRRLIRAHEDERKRLAREFHDDLTQRLARMAIDLGRCSPDSSGQEVSETIQRVREGLSRMSADIHALAYRLHPILLEDLGLTEALRAECDRFSRAEALLIEQDLCPVPASLSRDSALCLYRVAQECLRNVVLHAGPSRVRVLLTESNGGLELSVRDDGVGFDPANRKDKGNLGLASMRERIELVAGRLVIESAPGKGTKLTAWVPLQEDT